MEHQVRHLNDVGGPAIVITDNEDNKLIQQVLIRGNYIIVYGSPKCLLSTESLRSIFEIIESIKEMLIGVAMRYRGGPLYYTMVF